MASLENDVLLPAAHAITQDDHGGIANIAAGTCLVMVLIFIISRLLLRWPSSNALFGDDVAAIIATVFATIQCFIVIASVEHGFGKSRQNSGTSTTAADEIQKMLYAAQCFYVLGLFISKCSVLLLELRISQETKHIRIVQTTLAVAAASLVASIVMVAVGCDVSHPWLQLSSPCSGMDNRWTAIGALGIALEIAIFGIIVRIFYQLQRKWPRKLKGITIFALRLPVVAFTGLRMASIYRTSSSSDPLFRQVLVVCWSQAELAYSLATMTVPCLMPFMSKLDTNLGALDPHTIAASDSGPYGLSQSKSRLRSAIKRNSQHMPLGSEVRLDDVHTTTSVRGPETDHRSIESDDSTKVIVKKQVDVTYEVNPFASDGGPSRHDHGRQ